MLAAKSVYYLQMENRIPRHFIRDNLVRRWIVQYLQTFAGKYAEVKANFMLDHKSHYNSHGRKS